MKTEVREINSSLAAIHILLEQRLMCNYFNKCNPVHPDLVAPDPTERKPGFLDDAPMPVEEELLTIREAIIRLNISRSTLDKLRNEGRLTTLKQNRSVRLLKSEVEEARGWYSLRKGKV